MIVSRVLAAAVLALTVAAPAPPARAQSGPMHPVAIVDPVLNTRAWTLTVPAGWSADGTMLPGSTCNGGTTPIYRATSADGQTGSYLLPRADWAWGAGVRPGSDCLPWHEDVSAKDFLTYQTRIDKVGFVRQVPMPAFTGSMPPGYHTDTARYLVRYSVNGRPVEELLSATVTCHAANALALGEQHSCSAFVSRWFAPLGKVQAMVPTFNAMKLTLDQQWMSAWTAAMTSRMQRMSEAQTQAMLAQGRLAQAQRTRAHQDFMASMQHGADVRNERFAAGQYRKQNNNDNYVDYILGCQRAYSGNTRVSAGNCPNRQTF